MRDRHLGHRVLDVLPIDLYLVCGTFIEVIANAKPAPQVGPRGVCRNSRSVRKGTLIFIVAGYNLYNASGEPEHGLFPSIEENEVPHVIIPRSRRGD